MKQRASWIVGVILICIVCLGGIFRFYQLGSIPSGLTDDEANAGYDAYSLSVTGKDQWNQRYPVFSFKGFGDYRSPVYTYLLLPLLPFMEMNPFWLRFPAAFLGTISIILFYVVARKLGLGRNASLIGALFLAVNPWHVGMSRTAMVIVSGVWLLLMGMTFLLYAKKRIWMVIGGCICFALTIYAYPAYLVVTPLVVLYCGIHLWQTKEIQKKDIAIGISIVALLVCPYLIASNQSSYGVRMGQVNMFRDSGTVDVLNEKIGACQKVYPSVVCKMTYNRVTTFGMKFVVNYIRHFSPDLLFSTGTSTQYSVLPARGLLFALEYALFIIGVFSLIIHIRKPVSLFLLAVLLFAPIPDTLTGDGHYGRYFVIIPFIQYIAAYGFESISIVKKGWVTAGVVGILFLESAFFGVEYLTYFPYAYSRYSHYGYKELSDTLAVLKDSYDEIYVSGRVNDAKQYIFYLFYEQFDPVAFQQEKDIERFIESNGWIRVRRIGNIYFVPSFPEVNEDIYQKDTKILYIGAPSEFPKVYLPKQVEIKDKRGDVLFEGVTLYDWKRCLEIDCRREE